MTSMVVLLPVSGGLKSRQRFLEEKPVHSSLDYENTLSASELYDCLVLRAVVATGKGFGDGFKMAGIWLGYPYMGYEVCKPQFGADIAKIHNRLLFRLAVLARRNSWGGTTNNETVETFL
jgi:hypothetical protein